MMNTLSEALGKLMVANHALIEATIPMCEPDLCEDPRIAEFIHAVNNYADGVGTLLGVMKETIDVEYIA